MGGLGLRAASDHAGAAYAASFTGSQGLRTQMLSTPDDEEPAGLPQQVLASLTLKFGEETTADSSHGQTQRMPSLKIDLGNQQHHSGLVGTAGERMMARMASLSLPYAESWLNCSPIHALDLHIRSPEFAAAVKLRIGLQVYNTAGTCPAYGRESNTMGGHAMVCKTGGERIETCIQ